MTMYLTILALTISASLLGFAYYTSRDSGDDQALAESFHRAQAGQAVQNWEPSDGR